MLRHGPVKVSYRIIGYSFIY